MVLYGMMIFPYKLVLFYPVTVVSHWEYLFYGILVALITSLCVRMAVKKKYVWLVVWSYYLITLLPVLGIIQIGGQLAAEYCKGAIKLGYEVHPVLLEALKSHL